MPTVYLLDPVAVRHSDPNLSPVSGAKLHTWVAGTTTNLATYTDATGSTPLSNPIVADTTGIFPEIWITSGAYDFECRKSDDMTVLWNRLNITAPGAATTSLQTNLAAANGASLVGFQQNGTGAVVTDMLTKARRQLDVEDFGAVGTSDDTSTFIKAITACAVAGGGVVNGPDGMPTLNILGTILLASNVHLDLKGATLAGSGAAGNTLIETGYLSSGTILSNIASPVDTNRVINCKVYNGKIATCGRAFNLKNFNEGSEISDIEFQDCGYNVYSQRPFYSEYIGLTSRGTAGGASNAAFYWTAFENVCRIESIRTIGRTLAYQIDNGSSAQTIWNTTAEGCANGWLFQGTVRALRLFGNYFEGITGKAWEFSGGGSAFVGCDIDSNWYNNVETCISAINMSQSRWGVGNRRESGNCTVDFSDSSNSVVVEFPRTFGSTNITSPGLPTGYTLGVRCIPVGGDTLVDGGGSPTVRADNYGTNLIPFRCWGNPGDPGAGTIPFCKAATKSVGDPYEIYVDTNITTTTFGVVLFHIKVTDGGGTYFMYGRIYGLAVKQDDASGKSVLCSDNAGKLTLTLGSGLDFTGTFNQPTGTVHLI
jgi:hypothetical protein